MSGSIEPSSSRQWSSYRPSSAQLLPAPTPLLSWPPCSLSSPTPRSPRFTTWAGRESLRTAMPERAEIEVVRVALNERVSAATFQQAAEGKPHAEEAIARIAIEGLDRVRDARG